MMNALPVLEEAGVESERSHQGKAASGEGSEHHREMSKEHTDNERDNVRIDTMMHGPGTWQSKMTLPVPPPKSELRASRILPSFAIALDGLAKGTEVHVRPMSVSGDPMDAYLSSEDSESMSEYEESISETDEYQNPRY